MLVNSSERKNPPITNTAIITTTGVPGRKPAQAAMNAALRIALTVSVQRNPKAQNCRDDRLHAHGAECGRERDQAGFERRHVEAELQQKRQQERQRADPNAKDESAEHAGAKGREAEQRN